MLPRKDSSEINWIKLNTTKLELYLAVVNIEANCIARLKIKDIYMCILTCIIIENIHIKA